MIKHSDASDSTTSKNNGGELVMFTNDAGDVKIEAHLEKDNVWLSQSQMAELFQKDRTRITRHIKAILDQGELDENVVCAENALTTRHGAIEGKMQKKAVKYYNLAMIIAVGYRVRSNRGIQFRKWATDILHEYIQKGFAINDEQLKSLGGGTYWHDLMNRIRDIRSSEKVFWRQVLDIFATSVDYDPKSEDAQLFFKIVQNKMHFAVHGNTAAEVVYNRSDSDRDFMGLTTFAGTLPNKDEVIIAKNYLTADELQLLNRIVSGYLEFAETRALKHTPMYMRDWVEHINKTLDSQSLRVLDGAGAISHEQAVDKAVGEHVKFQKRISLEPTPVEKHFLESVKGLQLLADEVK